MYLFHINGQYIITNNYFYNIKWHGMLVLNMLTCHYIHCTNILWGGGILWFCHRYVVTQTLHQTHENPYWNTSTCYMYIYIGERIAGTKDEPNLIFEYLHIFSIVVQIWKLAIHILPCYIHRPVCSMIRYSWTDNLVPLGVLSQQTPEPSNYSIYHTLIWMRNYSHGARSAVS